MENLHNTAATYDQNQDYLKDPTRPESKPYSTKQQAANQAQGGRSWLYHKTKGEQIFDAEDMEQAEKDGWSNTPFKHPNNPDHQAPVDASENNSETDALKLEAERIGLKVDKRWSNKRLREEIVKAA